MVSDSLFILTLGGILFLFVGMVVYFWKRENSDKDFFTRHPISEFWVMAPFKDLPKAEFDLFGVDRVQNDFSGVEASFLKETGGKIGSFERPALVNREAICILKEHNYTIQYPVQLVIGTRLIYLEKVIATLRASGFGSSSSIITLDTEEQLEVIPLPEFQKNPLFQSTVKKWIDGKGEIIAISYRPTGNRDSLVRVLAIKKTLAPKLQDTILAFFHI